MEPHRHEGIFIIRGREDALATRNLVPGESVYGEKRVEIEENEAKLEYRVWNPFRWVTWAGGPRVVVKMPRVVVKIHRAAPRMRRVGVEMPRVVAEMPRAIPYRDVLLCTCMLLYMRYAPQAHHQRQPSSC